MRLLLKTGGVFLRLDLDPDASVFDVVISISPSSIHPDAKLAPSNDNEDEILRHVITDTAAGLHVWFNLWDSPPDQQGYVKSPPPAQYANVIYLRDAL